MSDLEHIALQALSRTTFDTYWLDSLDAVEDQPALEQDTECDLLVVGGGFCGLWGAIQAKEQNPDRDVVLIEARSIANGASGRPAAIMTTSVMHGIDKVAMASRDCEVDGIEVGRTMEAAKQVLLGIEV